MVFSSSAFFRRLVLASSMQTWRRSMGGGSHPNAGLAWAALFGLSATAGGWASSSKTYSSADESIVVVARNVPHTLFVWDFDWTIVNCNSDEYIPAQFFTDEGALTQGFRELLDAGNDWHACVQAMVHRAMDQHGATPQGIMTVARQMPYLKGVKETVDAIHRRHPATGQMILSDGNTLFIGAFLKANGLTSHFSHGVTSNQGQWVQEDTSNDKTRLLVVHQSQQHGGHDCDRCSENLCKTQALGKSLESLFDCEEKFGHHNEDTVPSRPRIVYIGDGANDACPALKVLKEGDVLLARVGKRRKYPNGRVGEETDGEAMAGQEEGGLFGLLPALQRARDDESAGELKCCVLEWTTGEDLKYIVDKLLEEIQ